MAKEIESNNSANSMSHSILGQANDHNSPKELLETLSKSNDEILRGAIALNPATPIDILEGLLNDNSSYVLSCLRKRGYKTRPVFIKPNAIFGHNLILRDATINDAAFIVELRTNEKKSAYISKTANDVNRQEAWLEKYSKDCEQVYFVILSKEQERVGTVRLYDIQGDSFCWGSWVLKDGAANSYAIESALLVYHFGLSLGFNRAHFDVRKGNQSVWKFHERFGAIRISETNEDYLYNISLENIQQSLKKYVKYLPNGFAIED
jgi:RimJ/RimL family protein N-acetyltransferase